MMLADLIELDRRRTQHGQAADTLLSTAERLAEHRRVLIATPESLRFKHASNQLLAQASDVNAHTTLALTSVLSAWAPKLIRLAELELAARARPERMKAEVLDAELHALLAHLNMTVVAE